MPMAASDPMVEAVNVGSAVRAVSCGFDPHRAYCSQCVVIGNAIIASALRAAEQRGREATTINCPLCGETVVQVASATLSLALSQHIRWVCKGREASEARIKEVEARWTPSLTWCWPTGRKQNRNPRDDGSGARQESPRRSSEMWSAHISHAIEFNGCVRCGTLEREFAITIPCPYGSPVKGFFSDGRDLPGGLKGPASGAPEDVRASSSESTGALPSDAMTPGWCVRVSVFDDLVVSISDRELCGRDLSEADKTLIRGCARHLLSFVGD